MSQQPVDSASQPTYGTTPSDDPSAKLIQQQPNEDKPSINWAPSPDSAVECPPGLEYLAQIDTLLIREDVGVFQLMTDIETANTYVVRNKQGQQIYYVSEEINCCDLQCCGEGRPFEMRIFDNTKKEVIHLSRPLRCNSCCCWCCCLQELTVEAPPGNRIGKVNMDWSPCWPSFTVTDENDETTFTLKGPCITCSCGNDVEFDVHDTNDEKVGRIAKEWAGLLKEALTDADNFAITFPESTEVKNKAVLLGAIFLIDFIYFGKRGRDDN
ncbi:uncharacterized protein TRIADDRAFT_24095 [Trichoplax adhaerens]|uniref:Phospholipid scramblase n=1 Tax=Trichoplax adhaerens TaxID=10228 RepID=B3RTR4_TRIAD|nr:hypothetical protein TRIADDRAFT_24095 [Trichoplax adhaerens]EDV26179.1 hypothetical protein TRIADDRAFT_24095 [Trichoplax adhaerens]|eukprot:XP_002112212.1 hypothetical protein TRIADDRAFT_24095 [Trichoplax adhaerens]